MYLFVNSQKYIYKKKVNESASLFIFILFFFYSSIAKKKKKKKKEKKKKNLTSIFPKSDFKTNQNKNEKWIKKTSEEQSCSLEK